MGDTFSNINDSTIINRPAVISEGELESEGFVVDKPRLRSLLTEAPPWLVKDDGHMDYGSVYTWRHIATVEKGARVSLDEKLAQIRMYIADHAEDTLEEGERAIFTDITTILDGAS